MTIKNIPENIVFGIHPIVELLKAKRRSITRIYTTKPFPQAWNTISPLLHRHIPLQIVDRQTLTRIAHTPDHQGVVALVTPFPFRAKPFNAERHAFLVLIDGVQDPRNLGGILRTAYCTGVQGIILSKKASAPLTATALKASAGLAEHLEIYRAPSSVAAAQELRSLGYNIYLSTLTGKNATTIAYVSPACVVIGNEEKGVSAELKKYGEQVTLPQRSPDISYNASVAAGILLFLMGQQLHTI